MEIRGSHAKVDLSSAYRNLSGIDLTLADYCITLTLTQLSAIRSVSILVRGQELSYRDSQRFRPKDVLLSSTEDVVATVDVTLYAIDPEGRLTAVPRTLDLYEGDTQAEALVAALRQGPWDRDCAPPCRIGSPSSPSGWMTASATQTSSPPPCRRTPTGRRPAWPSRPCGIPWPPWTPSRRSASW